jgi:hypothetical protein
MDRSHMADGLALWILLSQADSFRMAIPTSGAFNTALSGKARL